VKDSLRISNGPQDKTRSTKGRRPTGKKEAGQREASRTIAHRSGVGARTMAWRTEIRAIILGVRARAEPLVENPEIAAWRADAYLARTPAHLAKMFALSLALLIGTCYNFAISLPTQTRGLAGANLTRRSVL
jgi:hypothetical protein